MKKLLIAVLAFLLLLPACGREEEKAKGRPGAKRETQLTPREAYQQNVASRLQGLERQVKRLQAAVEKTPAAERARVQSFLGDLAQELAAAQQKFKELQGAGDKSWQESKPGMDTALASLEKSLEQARKASQVILLAQKRAFQKQVAGQLREKLRQVQTLNNQVKKASPKSRAALYPELDDLQKKMEAARKKFRDLKAAGGERWEDLAPGMEASLKDLQKSYQTALTHYRNLAAPKKKSG